MDPLALRFCDRKCTKCKAHKSVCAGLANSIAAAAGPLSESEVKARVASGSEHVRVTWPEQYKFHARLSGVYSRMTEVILVCNPCKNSRDALRGLRPIYYKQDGPEEGYVCMVV